MKITHPFPIRPDVVVGIELPDDLTTEEAERVGHAAMNAASAPNAACGLRLLNYSHPACLR